MNVDKNIIYEVLPLSSLDKIEPMWDQLRKHHLGKSPYFKERYRNISFHERKEALLAKDELYIDIAKEAGTNVYAGYCISSIYKNINKIEGEIESILVMPEYRKFGIGNALMKRGLDWLTGKKADLLKIVVAAGNEEVLPFYEKYGFYHFSNILMYRK
jgi:ribosomal protein S18 acetylase RimI-like enzyme